MKVLVVENNPELLKLLTHLLEKDGFDVSSAIGGKDALSLFSQQRPAVVCLDIMLDDVSGFDICRQMRKGDAAVQIILITSKSRQVDVNAGMAAGANDYIVKPFDLADITARMRDVARNRIASASPAAVDERFDFGDLAVYPGRLLAERGEELIDLGLRDVTFLKLFHDQKGRTLAPAALLGYCWNSPSAPQASPVEWQITQLRRKVEIDPASPQLIKSTPDGGYRFG